jgi:hypothetical protein
MLAIRVSELTVMRELRASSLICAIASVLLICPTSIGQEQEEAANARKAAEEQEAAARKQHRAALEELERQKQILMQQHVEAERQRQRVEEQLARQKEAQAEHAARVQTELQRAQAQVAELMARHEAAKADLLPENAQLRVFHLQHVNPHSLTDIVASIMLNNAPRIAVDERSNSLLVAGNEKQISLVEELAQTLDRPTAVAGPQDAGETLQLRVVWLLDINEGMEPNDKLVSPQVIEALGELGFQEPKVVCQQVTTLTLSEEDGGRRRGHFNFSVPVLIESQSWYFEGEGQIEPMADSRFNLRFDMRFQQYAGQGGNRHSVNEGKLGGSIFTPLGHYTVMGTTTFVATTSNSTVGGENSPDAMLDQLRGERWRRTSSDGPALQQEQHLSAFVVYLDRAKEFPAQNTLRKSEADE